MKIKTLAIVVLSALSLSSTAALADTTPTTVNGGTVHFKGEVVNAACAVDAGSVDQTVQLGQVRTATLKQAGATSSAVGFNIQLMIAIPLLPQKPLLPSWGRRLTVLILKSWLYRVQLRVAQQTLACRFWTEQVMS